MPDEPAPARYAFFDLDGTLLPWDTQLLFCNFVLRRQGWRRVLLMPVLLILPLAALRLVGTRLVKRVFLGFLAGLTDAEVADLAGEFAREVVEHCVWPEMREQVELRRSEGCVLVLNTASPVLYAEPIARLLGFQHCVGTLVDVLVRMPLVPVFDGPNNKRAAKVDAMRQRGPLSPETVLPIPGSWTYTDSAADIPLLQCAERGVLVHPSAWFVTLAPAHDWTVMHPPPAVSRLHRILAGLAMFCGCWRLPAAFLRR